MATYRGDYPVIGSLATLAYDTRRGAFFEKQLIAALRIVQGGDVSAGGHDRKLGRARWGIRSSCRPPTWTTAVDFDGDGKRAIWGDDPTDALASTAVYLKKAGWVAGQPWGLEVTLPEGFDYGLAESG